MFFPKMRLSGKQYIFIENLKKIDSLFIYSRLSVVPLTDHFHYIMGYQFIHTDLYLCACLRIIQAKI